MKALVSVIVPIYNISEYLEECVLSLLKQTYVNMEIILVDDGSSDNSGEICDKYAKLDSRVIVIHKKNEGLVATRKKGLEISKGEYIVNVDGDDWVDEKYIEKLVEKMEDGVEIVQCGVWFNTESINDEHRLSCPNDLNVSEEKKNELLERWLSGNAIIESYIWNKIYTRKVFEQSYMMVPNDMCIGEDIIFFINMIEHVKRIRAINEPLYYYRVRNNSLSHDNDIYKLMQHDIMTNYIVSCIKKMSYTINDSVIRNWYINRKVELVRRLDPNINNIFNAYKIKGLSKIRGKRIIIYGAGRVGAAIYNQLVKEESIKVVSWVDRNYKQCEKDYYNVKSLSTIGDMEFDLIVIAINNKSIAQEIRDDLIHKYYVDSGKIYWEKPKYIWDGE